MKTLQALVTIYDGARFVYRGEYFIVDDADARKLIAERKAKQASPPKRKVPAGRVRKVAGPAERKRP